MRNILCVLIGCALCVVLVGCVTPVKTTYPDGRVVEEWVKQDITEADLQMFLAFAEALKPYIVDDKATEEEKDTWDRMMEVLNSPTVQALASQNVFTQQRIEALQAAEAGK
jgi:hypothetical protein